MHPIEFPDRFFVTGTDTDVGKTLISAILMTGLNALYWKPIQSGQQGLTDTQWVQQATGFTAESVIPETYRLSEPLSPHASAENEGIEIHLSEFCLPENDSRVIVEGAGGVMVPLNETHLMIDLIHYLNLPVLLVARSSLGTINHTLLSLEILRQRKVEVLGVVMNGPPNESNKHAIEYYGQIQVLAQVDILPEINIQTLEKAYLECFIKKRDKREK